MNTHFANCQTSAEVKNEFRRLAFRYHPDAHAASDFDKYNTIIRDIIEAYHVALSRRDGEVFTGTDEREHTYRYNRDTEDTIVDAVARSIRAKLPASATVTIVGIYVWVEGLTSADHAAHAILKAFDEQDAEGKFPPSRFFFHSKRQAWYCKPVTYRARYNPTRTLDDLKGYYGASVVHKDDTDSARSQSQLSLT